ncbi:MAG: hypothetical protein G01um101493_224 [Microgenomates group bacterium Gr01-1014_93]|nr:MAG: hypothetical protein G01um101493_224 [Microgenomates group bacterium Gr01-1014_93]
MFLFWKSKSAILMLLISGVGIVLFLGVTAVFPFKSALFNMLYGKPISQALEGPSIPTVELSINGAGEKHINLTTSNTPLKIVWKTSNVKSCIGRAWGLTEKDETWSGLKDPGGGEFKTGSLTKNNTYIYTIDCANEFGDAEGDAVVINIGAPNLSQNPYITYMEVSRNNEKSDLNKPITVSLDDEINISWTSLNLSSPYSVCFATGSWPTLYQNVSKTEVVETFRISGPKVYRYSLYCSNEAGITKKTVTVTPG